MGYVPEIVDYDMYAKMDYWNFEEAIWLTASYKLREGTYNSKDDYTIEYNKEYNKLAMILNRSIESNSSQLREFNVVYDIDELPLLNMSYVPPFWFVKWVMFKRYELPREITELELTDFSVSDINGMVERNHNKYLGLVEVELDDDMIDEISRTGNLDNYYKVKEHTNKPVSMADNEPDDSAVTHAAANDIAGHKYCFVKTAQSWNLKFGYVELEGVKDLVGMDYIQILLKNPGVSIGVYQIQAMMNPIGIKAPESTRKQEIGLAEGHSAFFASSNNSSKSIDTRSSKSVSLDNLRKRLKALSQERSELDPDYDYMDIERLDTECSKIAAEIDNVMYSKNDDPELKRNRDKVSKNIIKALENIKSLEEKKGYTSTPLCNFLKTQIKAASECVYTPPVINPPQWIF